MGLETVTNVSDLNRLWPLGSDQESQGDNHLRNLKTALLNNLVGFPGAIAVTGADGGVANAYTLTPATGTLLAYGNRMIAVFSPVLTNVAGTVTLNIGGLGTRTVLSVSGAPLVANDLVLGNIYAACYNGSEFRLLSATKNYVDQLAFTSVLPAQFGNSGKFLTTDGATASWTDGFPVLAESALIALPVTSAANNLRHVVPIDANRVALIFGSTAALQGICYDRSTKLFGAGFLIRSGNFLSSAILSATDKILVTSVASGAAAFEAVVLSFSGTAGTVNTAAAATLPENTMGIVMAPNSAAVGSTFVFGLALASSNRTIAVTVSGTTPSIGTSVTLPGSATTGQITVRGIDSTRLLATYTSGSNILFCPITVSAGTTLTAGTQASTAATVTSIYGPYVLSSGRFAVAYVNTNSYGAVVSISGAVASVSIALLGTGNVGTCVKVGDRLLVGSNAATVNALTDVAGTATAGTSVAISTHTLVGYGPDYAAYSSGAGPNSYFVVKLSGNNPVISETAGCAPFNPGTTTGADEVFPRIYNLNGKSATIGVGATPQPFALVFAATGIDPKLRQSSSEPLSTPVMQSASVGWCSGSVASATSVKLTRVEMI